MDCQDQCPDVAEIIIWITLNPKWPTKISTCLTLIGMTVNVSGTWFLPSGKRQCFPTEHLCQTVKHGDSLWLQSANNKNIVSITSCILCPLLSASLLTTAILTSLTFIFHCCNSSSGTKLHVIKTQAVVKHSSPMYLATGRGDKFALEFSWLCTECRVWFQSLSW